LILVKITNLNRPLRKHVESYLVTIYTARRICNW